MTATVVLAAVAGLCAAAALVELLQPSRGARPARPTRGGRVGAMAIVLARVAARLGVRLAPAQQLRARLAAAGAPLGLTELDVMALKGAVAVIAALLALPVATLAPGRSAVALLVLAPAAGFACPDVVLRRQARRRGEQIARELADVLDLLRVAIEAGLPTGRALGEVGQRCGGLLAAELARAAARIELGLTRAEALRELAQRCPAAGVATLVAAVARADRHGSPLAPALDALAADARAEQARRLRDDAARAAPKIQLVVALVLVPSALLLVGAVLVRSLGAV